MSGVKERYPNPGPPMSPEFLAGIKAGVAAIKAGRVTSWEQVEQELFSDRKGVRKMACDFGLPLGWIDENIPEDGQAGRGDFGH